MYRPPKNPEIFDISVWETVKQIPAGKVATYGQIAGLIPIPDGETEQTYQTFGARWVGGAMRRCPDSVPWHRVINSQGKISPRDEAAVRRQRDRLEAEGVVFDSQGKIDLGTYQWEQR